MGGVSRVRRGYCSDRCPGHILFGVTTEEVNPTSTRDSASREFHTVPYELFKGPGWILNDNDSDLGRQMVSSAMWRNGND